MMAAVEPFRGISGPCERGVVLEGVSWATYEKLIDGFGDQRSYVTYDSGVMEIEMSPGRIHESDTDFLTRLIHLVSFLKRIPVESGGSTTHRSPELANGVEPDACYWVANEKVMRGVQELDLAKHPVPDLVIEVDVTSSSIDRIEVFRQLGVPEIWRVRDDTLEFLVLQDSVYSPAEASVSFPFIERGVVARAMEASRSIGETEAIDQLLSNLGLC